MKEYNKDLIALSGKQIGIPVKLPEFNPQNDIPAKPEYSKDICWVAKPDYFDTAKQRVDVFWVYPNNIIRRQYIFDDYLQ